MLEDLADTQIDPALYAVTVLEYGRHEAAPEMHYVAARDLGRLYDDLEGRLGGQPFFCGDFSLADIARASRGSIPTASIGGATGSSWVVKNGFAPWLFEEMRAGRAFFPLATSRSG